MANYKYRCWTCKRDLSWDEVVVINFSFWFGNQTRTNLDNPTPQWEIIFCTDCHLKWMNHMRKFFENDNAGPQA